MIKDFSLDGMVGKQLDFFIDSILGIPHRTSIFTVILNASNNIVERGKVPDAKTQAAIYRISLISMETDVKLLELGHGPFLKCHTRPKPLMEAQVCDAMEPAAADS